MSRGIKICPVFPRLLHSCSLSEFIKPFQRPILPVGRQGPQGKYLGLAWAKEEWQSKTSNWTNILGDPKARGPGQDHVGSTWPVAPPT